MATGSRPFGKKPEPDPFEPVTVPLESIGLHAWSGILYFQFNAES